MEIEKHKLYDETYRKLIFTELMQEHQDRIRHYCVNRLGETRGEEIAQDVCLTAWENLATFRQESTIATWLLGIAKYKCAQLFRKQRRRQMISTHYVDEICYQIYADRTRSIEDKLLYEEQWKNLIYGLSKIRQTDQWVLNLRFFQNLSIIELAEVLGKSKAAAHKQLSRALGRLRNITNVGMAGYN